MARVSLKSSVVSVGNPQMISVAKVILGTRCLKTLTTRQKITMAKHQKTGEKSKDTQISFNFFDNRS